MVEVREGIERTVDWFREHFDRITAAVTTGR